MQLLLQSTWDTTDLDALHDVQSQVYTLLKMFGDGNCEMCDCLEFTNGTWNKAVPDGHGGSTFVPVDPRTEGTVPPPWPTPPAGQTGNCLASHNIGAVFKSQQLAYNDVLSGTATVWTAFTIVASFVSAIIPVVGEIFDLTLTIATAIVDAGAAAWSALFTGTTGDSLYAEVDCLFACYAASNGMIDATAIEFAKSDFATWCAAHLTGPQAALAELIFGDFCDVYGPNGLSRLAAAGGVTSADCSGCDCGWRHHFDFTSSDGGFVSTHDAVWSPGLGWLSDGTPEILIQHALSHAENFKHLRFHYKYTGFESGSSNASAMFTPSLSIGNRIVLSGLDSPEGDCILDTNSTYSGLMIIGGNNSSVSVAPVGTITLVSADFAGDGTDPF